MDSQVEKNVSQIKDGTYGKKINDKSVGYKKGAIIGLIVGVVGGFYFKKNLFLFGTIGLVGGGYIGYKIAEASDVRNSFVNLGSSVK